LAECFFLHRLLPQNPWTTSYYIDCFPQVKNYLESKETESPSYNLNLPLIVPQPPAACMMVDIESFYAVSGFDERFYPAWFEDVDFCKKLEKIGKLSAVVGTAKVTHEGGYSKNLLGDRAFFKTWYLNLYKYCEKHFDNREFLALKTLLPIAIFLRILVFFVPLKLVRKFQN
jgi:GT2 family glycosyltransferase